MNKLNLLLIFLPSPDAELARFPPRQMVQEFRAFNQAYQRHLEGDLALFPYHGEARESLREARLLYLVWDALDDAQIRHCLEARWEALLDLRRLIGDDAYFRGRMPPPVPLRRFVEVD